MDGREVVWMALAILALLALAEIAYNLIIYVPHTVYPTPGSMPKSATSNKNTTIVFNPIPYYASLPTIINDSALISLNISKIFISNDTGAPILQNIVEILSMNASEVTPTTYFAVADLGGFYVNYKLAKTVNYTIEPFPLNTCGTEPNMTQTTLILQYYNFSPYVASYPPSDKVCIGSVSCKIINTCSVETKVSVSYNYCLYLAKNVTCKQGCNVYEDLYYCMKVKGSATFYINCREVCSESFCTVFQCHGGSYSKTLCSQVTVPPGVSKTVCSYFNVYSTFGYCCHTCKNGSITYHIYKYYPKTPCLYKECHTYNWYEYNISVPVSITVFNGTSPTTEIGSNTYDTRNININFSYTVWSSDPQSFVSNEITTYDIIHYGNFTIKRTWNAGSIEIIPQLNTQSSGNTINCYLSFSINSSSNEQPSWVFNNTFNLVYEHNYANDYGQLAYYYALYKFLYNLVEQNTTSQYYNYINWEMDVFANEIALQMKMTNNNYQGSTIPYLCALFNRSGNQTLIAMQPVLIMSWGAFYHVFNGTYNVKGISGWTYSIIIVKIPEYILNTTPYIILENSSNSNVTAYLTDPTNVEQSFVVFWWYSKNETMYTNLPEDGQAITFYTWYPYNYDNVPIYFKTMNQTFTVEFYNSTVYNYTKQP